MKHLTVIALFLLSASMALADKGSITVTNNGNHTVNVWAYDWDDGVRGAPSFPDGSQRADPGQTVTVTCIKGLFQPDSPGCQIQIFDDNRDADPYDFVKTGKYNSGTYIFSGSWDYVDNTNPLSAENFQVGNVVGVAFTAADPVGSAIVTPPAGAVSLGRTFDMSKPATSSSILETGSFRLAWQDDGNLVVYKDGGTPVWASNTNGTGAGFYFGSGGDLKIYGGGGFNDNKWGVSTYKDNDPDGLGGDRLFLFPDGNLLVLNSNNRALWQTGAPN